MRLLRLAARGRAFRCATTTTGTDKAGGSMKEENLLCANRDLRTVETFAVCENRFEVGEEETFIL